MEDGMFTLWACFVAFIFGMVILGMYLETKNDE